MKVAMKRYSYEVIEKGAKGYPKYLNALKEEVKKVYVIGNKEVLSEFSIAVVGARRCTSFGKECAKAICDDLAKSQIPLVSGFALGIDSIAHLSAIENKQKTVAVLAGGFNHIYPPENIKMMDDIIGFGGAIISEFSEDEEPYKQRFPQRNRIIAALSEGVVVIEAGKKSGSLITTEYAKKLNKKLFVLPGRICDENYEGSNQLLVEGALCIRNAEDILKIFAKEKGKNFAIKRERMIPSKYQDIDTLLKKPHNANQLAKKLSKSISEVQALLTMMELEGWIIPIGRGEYLRSERRIV